MTSYFCPRVCQGRHPCKIPNNIVSHRGVGNSVGAGSGCSGPVARQEQPVVWIEKPHHVTVTNNVLFARIKPIGKIRVVVRVVNLTAKKEDLKFSKAEGQFKFF